MKFDLEIKIFMVKGICGNFQLFFNYFLTIFYVFSGSNYIRKPSKNLAYIRNEIWPWIVDFQGEGCLREPFHYFPIFSAWNYIEIPSQTFMTNETNFLHCTQKNDFINKCHFCDSNKSRFIFLGKRFFTTWPFLIFKNEFLNGWNYKKTIFQNKIFINKLLYLIINNSISKIGNGHVAENLFPKKMNHD